MVEFGMDNSRVRDFYDVWWLSCRAGFDGILLRTAFARTVACRRGTQGYLADTPRWIPSFDGSMEHGKQGGLWTKWVSGNRLPNPPPPFPEVIRRVREFGLPIVEAVRDGRDLNGRWHPDVGWETYA